MAEEAMEKGDLKRKLFEAFAGIDRGLTACSETRAEVVGLITQLEAKNPTPAPTEAIALLDGKWILLTFELERWSQKNCMPSLDKGCNFQPKKWRFKTIPGGCLAERSCLTTQ